MTLITNLKANVATISSVLVVVAGFSFWFGTQLAAAKTEQALINQEVQSLKQKQTDYDKTQRALMTTVNIMSINVERVAAKLGVETK